MGKTVEEGFETLIGWLEPLTSERTKSTSHKSSVNSCLVNNFGCTNLFETGSFGNGTGVRHYSDTDYFAVIPADNLHDNSSTALRQVKEALQTTFSTTSGIAVSCPAVKIPFGTYKSEEMEVHLVVTMGWLKLVLEISEDIKFQIATQVGCLVVQKHIMNMLNHRTKD